MKLPAEIAETLGKNKPIYILSPHLDDAIWSVGGLLQSLVARGHHHIVLISIFTHTVYVYGGLRAPAEATAIRKSEDYNAAHAAGLSTVLFLDFPDGILRDTPETSVINPSYQTPPYLLDMVTEQLERIIPDDAVVLAPAAFGGHMDHLTTRRAAMQLKQPKILYRDMPYGSRQTSANEAQEFLGATWKNFQITLQPDEVKAHLELFWYYPSQASQEVANEIGGQLGRDGLNLWLAKNVPATN